MERKREIMRLSAIHDGIAVKSFRSQGGGEGMTIVSFLVACLAGMGVGSGGLFVIYLTLFSGMPQLEAQGLNLHFFIFATAAALLLHARTLVIPLRRLAYVCGVGSIGCAGGAALAQHMDGDSLRTVFAIVLIGTGAVTLFTGKSQKMQKFEKTLYK
ncbi:MAG: sulfite exporter TauE/SafE family protein [Clostridia bacterium]|nr:sulfite exporter TauE/SafE family protein [Clostridia bacterium]